MRRRAFGSVGHEVQLRADEYRLLRDLVHERLGIWFGPESRLSLERRLRERLVANGLDGFADYHQFLKYSPLAAHEWDEAAELLTTNETYFFREDYQLRAFKNELLPMLAEKNRQRRRVRIWSAGCSTGEEAYTIAILLLESGLFAGRRDEDGWDVRVYGSDLSKQCITAARRGVYGPSSFRSTEIAVRDKWFTEEGENAWSVAAEARALCHFGQMNLLDEERTHLVGRCDIIFCRNVLLYFDAGVRRRVISMFYDRLVPGGVLLLGHAESLLNVSTAFELLHLQEDLVYRKPAHSERAPSTR